MTVEQLIEMEIKVTETIRALEEQIAQADLKPPGQLDGTEGRLSRQDSLMRHQFDQEAQRRRQQRLVLLKDALRRMDDGTYGICANCGRPITWERLIEVPEIPVCTSCAG